MALTDEERAFIDAGGCGPVDGPWPQHVLDEVLALLDPPTVARPAPPTTTPDSAPRVSPRGAGLGAVEPTVTLPPAARQASADNGGASTATSRTNGTTPGAVPRKQAATRGL